jgi:hypothetical protein
MAFAERTRARVASWLAPANDPLMEARAQPGAQPAVVERQGFEYGVPRQGINEVYSGLGASTQSDRRTMMQQLYEAFLACPWAWAAVNAIARTVTAGGLVMDWDSDTGEGDQDTPAKPANVLAVERLFKYCNEREDIRQLMRGVITDLLVFGDAFIEVVWMGSIPVALYSLDAPSLYPIADEHGKITGYVQVTDFGQRAEFDPRDVIHISLDSPRSGIYGVSPTQANLLPITAWLFAAATAKETFRKGNPPNIHVDHPASANETTINRWDATYAVRNIGPRNIGVPITTKGGGKVTELQRGIIKDYLEFMDQKRDEILAGYGVPPAEAGVIEAGNIGGGTGESQRKTFLTNTCQPIAELVLEKINFAILARGFLVADWHAKFAEVDMRDSKVIEEIRDLRLRSGAWTLDKYRADIGEPAVPGGDQPVLVDRQNLVLWSDMDAMSKATIAAKVKGSSLDVDEPSDGKPAHLSKPEPVIGPAGAPPAPGVTPPQLAAHAAAAAGAAAPGEPGQPPKPPPGQAGKAAAPVKEAEDTIGADWRRLSAAWTASYAARRRRALAELPTGGGR